MTLIRMWLAVALVPLALMAVPASAEDPPGSLAMDWPMGHHDGNQLIPGQGIRVMQNYNNPNTNTPYNGRRHAAIDLAVDVGNADGESVYAAADGVVTCASTGLHYPGRVVVIEHTESGGNTIYTQYGHLNQNLEVVEGQFVSRGMELGTVIAWPGDISNSHLHFEVRTFENWTDGNCWGPGYAGAGLTPGQQGWIDPIEEYFERRPAFPGYVVADAPLNIRDHHSLTNSNVVGTAPQFSAWIGDQAQDDASGADHKWFRVNYGGALRYGVSYLDQGWGGEIFLGEYSRYPGPVEVVDLASTGGNLYVFARHQNGSLRYRARFSSGVWGGWISLGGVGTSHPEVVVTQNGRLQLFVRGVHGMVWTRAQYSAGGGWNNWSSLGGPITSAPAAVVNANGRVQLFARWSDGSLRTRAQISAGGNWGGWQNLGGVITWGPAVGMNLNGRLSVFVGGLNNDLYLRTQASAGGSFSGWVGLGGTMTSHPAVVRNGLGRLEVFVRGGNHALRHISQASANSSSWGGWQSRGELLTSHPQVAANSSGRLEVFARLTDGQLYRVRQNSAGGNWSGWSHLGGNARSAARVVLQGSLLQVVTLTLNGQLQHATQFSSGNYSHWHNLGGTFAPF